MPYACQVEYFHFLKKGRSVYVKVSVHASYNYKQRRETQWNIKHEAVLIYTMAIVKTR